MSVRRQAPMSVRRAPLLRNRDFVLLQAGQLFSTAGTESTTIAYPLLVLALTHSPAKAGVVAFARLAPYAVFSLLAGVAADRWDRKRLMIAADAVRALAIAGLAAAVLVGDAGCGGGGRRRGAGGGGRAGGAGGRGRRLRARPRRPVPRRRRLVRLLVPLARSHAHAVPGGAGTRERPAPLADRRGLPLPLGPALSAHGRVPVRARQLRLARRVPRHRRRRQAPGPLERPDRRARRRLRRVPPRRLAGVAPLP